MKHNLFYTFALLFVLILFGCSGEDGRDGEDGNANVIASPWIPSLFSSDLQSFDSFGHTDPEITGERIETAAFLVYGRAQTILADDPVTQIPVTFPDATYSYQLFAEDNLIIFYAQSLDGSDIRLDNFIEFRYIIIPVADAAKSKETLPDYSKMSYGEVVSHFGLEY